MLVTTGDATCAGSWTLPDASIRCAITSPPYATQRRAYKGVSPKDYPNFTIAWLRALAPKLLENASVAVVIRSNQIKGGVSDYVLRTRLAIRAEGWLETEELIWVKTDPPPLGSTRRPRRAWESVLVLSRSPDPYLDTKTGGKTTGREYDYNELSARSGELHGGQSVRVGGRTRGTDVIETACGNGIDKRWPHPAPCPTALTDHLVQLLSEPGDLVCDPFAGSGGTGASALSLGRKFVGIDLSSRYVEMANERLSGGCLA